MTAHEARGTIHHHILLGNSDSCIYCLQVMITVSPSRKRGEHNNYQCLVYFSIFKDFVTRRELDNDQTCLNTSVSNLSRQC